MAPTREHQALEDRELVLVFQSGDRSAYEEIFRRHRGRVYATCSRLVGTQEAEEAVQETFLRAFQALPRFNGRYFLSAWLTRIASNVCVDQLRSKSRSNLIVLPEVPDVVPQQGPEELVASKNPRLERAIGEVQPSHAQALKLRAIGGLSHNEMADRLALSPSQVKALLHRARSSFKKAWEQAEGWLLAPLISLRSLFGERSGNAGSGLAGASPMLTSMTVERVATSVIIVAAALSAGPATVPGPSTDAAVAGAQAVPLEAGRPSPGADLGAGDRLSQRASRTAAAATEGLLPIGEAGAFLDDLADIRKQHRAKNAPDDREDEDGGGGPTSLAQSREVVRKVRDQAHEARELVDQD